MYGIEQIDWELVRGPLVLRQIRRDVLPTHPFGKFIDQHMLDKPDAIKQMANYPKAWWESLAKHFDLFGNFAALGQTPPVILQRVGEKLPADTERNWNVDESWWLAALIFYSDLGATSQTKRMTEILRRNFQPAKSVAETLGEFERLYHEMAGLLMEPTCLPYKLVEAILPAEDALGRLTRWRNALD